MAIIQKKIGIYPEIATQFSDEINDIIKTNLPKIIKNLEILLSMNSSPEILGTSLYNMKVNVDYSDLLSKFHEESKKLVSYN